MAHVLVCDGCLERAEKVTRLAPLGRVYCDACVEVLKPYVQERDELHDALAKSWSAGIAALREKHAAIFKGKLPDVSG